MKGYEDIDVQGINIELNAVGALLSDMDEANDVVESLEVKLANFMAPILKAVKIATSTKKSINDEVGKEIGGYKFPDNHPLGKARDGKGDEDELQAYGSLLRAKLRLSALTAMRAPLLGVFNGDATGINVMNMILNQVAPLGARFQDDVKKFIAVAQSGFSEKNPTAKKLLQDQALNILNIAIGKGLVNMDEGLSMSKLSLSGGREIFGGVLDPSLETLDDRINGKPRNTTQPCSVEVWSLEAFRYSVGKGGPAENTYSLYDFERSGGRDTFIFRDNANVSTENCVVVQTTTQGKLIDVAFGSLALATVCDPVKKLVNSASSLGKTDDSVKKIIEAGESATVLDGSGDILSKSHIAGTAEIALKKAQVSGDTVAIRKALEVSAKHDDLGGQVHSCSSCTGCGDRVPDQVAPVGHFQQMINNVERRIG